MKEVVKKLLYILPEKDGIKIVVLFLLMLIGAGLEVAGIGMIPAFVSIVASPEKVFNYDLIQPVFAYLNIQTSEDLLIWGSVSLVFVFIIKSIYMLIFNYVQAKFLVTRKYIISKKLMKSYMLAPYTFHLQKNTADLLRNITQEVNIVTNIILSNILYLTKEAVMTVSILIFLFIVEPVITLFVIFLAALGAGSFIILTQKKLKEFGLEQQVIRSSMIKVVNEGLGGIKDVRVLNRENEFINKFGRDAYKSSKIGIYATLIKQIPKPVVETSAVIGMMLISAILVWQGRTMDMIIPILSLFAIALVKLMPSIQTLSSLYSNVKYNIAALDPVYEDLYDLQNSNIKLSNDRKDVKAASFKNKLKVKNLSYQYPNAKEYALKDINLEIQKGSAVAFVGESGAGKTTLLDLMLGLLNPTKGEILVDGYNIRDKTSAWQRNIGYIPQFIYLADDTLRRNIAFGVPEEKIDDKKIMNAIELAQLKSLIYTLPDGLDTLIGEHGTRLSGGQRQRMGIARALYHEPDVLFMDEATSALDNITEKEIIKAIDLLKGEKTVITIAHRLTTVQNCDILYLMKNGRIMDSGTYDDLIKQNNEFKRMALI